jgi:hypothetical protein
MLLPGFRQSLVVRLPHLGRDTVASPLQGRNGVVYPTPARNGFAKKVLRAAHRRRSTFDTDDTCGIGTANLANRRFRLNLEITMLFAEPSIVGRSRECSRPTSHAARGRPPPITRHGRGGSASRRAPAGDGATAIKSSRNSCRLPLDFGPMAAPAASVHRGKGYLSLSGNNGEEKPTGTLHESRIHSSRPQITSKKLKQTNTGDL